MDEVAAHMDDASRFGNWKKQQLAEINGEITRLQGIAARFKPEASKPKEPKPEIEVPTSLTGDLRVFLEPIVTANEKFVGLWKEGKTGPLIGAARKAAAGKFEGKYIEAVLKEIVDGQTV